MQKKCKLFRFLMPIVFSLLVSNCSLHSLSTDWFSNTATALNKSIAGLLGKAETAYSDKLLQHYLKNPQEYKKKLNDIRTQIAQKLKEGDEDGIQALTDELKAEHEAIIDQVVKDKKLMPSEIESLKNGLKGIEDNLNDLNKEVFELKLLKSYNGIPTNGLETYQKELNKNNKYRNSPASVSTAKAKQSFMRLEDEYLKQRRKSSAPLSPALVAQERILALKLTSNKMLNIGLCFSGGGFRAMDFTLGCMIGLDKLGLVDAATYISTLSGSTWTLALYNILGSLDAINSSLEQKIKSNTFDLLNNVQKTLTGNDMNIMTQRVIEALWPKFVFKQPVRSVDLYGSLLAYTLLPMQGAPQHLSEQWDTIATGKKPFPLYTAVSVHKMDTKYQYNWYEFNPAFVRNVDLDYAIPSWAFGRKFEAGKSVEPLVGKTQGLYPPEQTLGFELGTFGSAFSVNLRDIVNMLLYASDKATGLDRIKVEAIKALIKVVPVDEMTIGINSYTVRAAPAQVNNPWKGMPDAEEWLKEREYITLVDGGIAFNLPLPSLVVTGRKLDLVIVGDASGNIAETTELQMFFDYAEEKGFEYERIDNEHDISFGHYRTKESSEKKGPDIIYINFKVDPTLLKSVTAAIKKDLASTNKEVKNAAQYMNTILNTGSLNVANFDYEKCLKWNVLKAVGSTVGIYRNRLPEEYCDTFNFNYNLDQFRQLRNVGTYNMLAHEKEMYDIIRELYAKKMKITVEQLQKQEKPFDFAPSFDFEM